VQLTNVGMLCCLFCTHLILRREVLDDLCYSLVVRLNPIFPDGKASTRALHVARDSAHGHGTDAYTLSAHTCVQVHMSKGNAMLPPIGYHSGRQDG
jgi:hypothetical protein